MKICYHSKKRVFNSERKALEFVERQSKIRNKTGILRAYLCEYCKGYHLSSQPLKEEAKTMYLKYYKQFKKFIN